MPNVKAVCIKYALILAKNVMKFRTKIHAIKTINKQPAIIILKSAKLFIYYTFSLLKLSEYTSNM